MRFSHDNISLWFGTPDAPMPGETAQASTEIPITVAVQPIDASNKIEIRYRTNQGPIHSMAAKWWRNDAYHNTQYFRAQFPPFRANDRVDYTIICYCAGRQVPSADEANQFAWSFRVIGGEVEPTFSQRALAPTRDIVSNARRGGVSFKALAQPRHGDTPEGKIPEGMSAAKVTLDVLANRLGNIKALRQGAILLRMTGPGGGDFHLDCAADGARLFEGMPSPETVLIEVMGDAARLLAIFDGKSDARTQFLTGGIRVRGDLRYLSDLALELGIITSPL
jgi:hypothetical protein